MVNPVVISLAKELYERQINETSVLWDYLTLNEQQPWIDKASALLASRTSATYIAG